ncbi:MAG: FAD-binding oxidoreductase, partial [Ornithinimicrobium sp.]
MSASLVVPSRRRPRWRELEIVDIARLNDQAVVVSLEVPPHLRGEFAFEPGQYLTLRAQIEGQDVRRSYSICMSRRAFAHSGRLRVASARVPAGLMSNWLN